MWRPAKESSSGRPGNLSVRQFSIKPGGLFEEKYDKVQQQLKQLSSMDDLLAGTCRCTIRFHNKTQHGDTCTAVSQIESSDTIIIVLA